MTEYNKNNMVGDFFCEDIFPHLRSLTTEPISSWEEYVVGLEGKESAVSSYYVMSFPYFYNTIEYLKEYKDQLVTFFTSRNDSQVFFNMIYQFDKYIHVIGTVTWWLDSEQTDLIVKSHTNLRLITKDTENFLPFVKKFSHLVLKDQINQKRGFGL
jgi:hypothetical protein